jgi:hypothetical protein
MRVRVALEQPNRMTPECCRIFVLEELLATFLSRPVQNGISAAIA